MQFLSIVLPVLGLVLFMTLGLSTAIAGSLISFPSFTVREDAFKVHSLIGSSPWLPWSSLKKVRRVYAPREAWIIGISGLDWIYFLGSFAFRMGMGSVFVTSGMGGYHNFIRILREKRPELFYA